MKITKSVFLSGLMLLILSLDGCVSQTLVNHTFEFNAVRESPDIEGLDYRYGESKDTSSLDWGKKSFSWGNWHTW